MFSKVTLHPIFLVPERVYSPPFLRFRHYTLAHLKNHFSDQKRHYAWTWCLSSTCGTTNRHSKSPMLATFFPKWDRHLLHSYLLNDRKTIICSPGCSAHSGHILNMLDAQTETIDNIWCWSSTVDIETLTFCLLGHEPHSKFHRYFSCSLSRQGGKSHTLTWQTCVSTPRQ